MYLSRRASAGLPAGKRRPPWLYTDIEAFVQHVGAGLGIPRRDKFNISTSTKSAQSSAAS